MLSVVSDVVEVDEKIVVVDGSGAWRVVLGKLDEVEAVSASSGGTGNSSGTPTGGVAIGRASTSSGASTDAVVTGSVSAGGVSTGDVSTGDVSTGGVSTGGASVEGEDEVASRSSVDGTEADIVTVDATSGSSSMIVELLDWPGATTASSGLEGADMMFF